MRNATAILLPLVLSAAAASAQMAVDGRQVKRAVEAGIRHLRAEQLPDGSWHEFPGFRGGSTALAVLAMLNAGVAPDDPVVARALAVVKAAPHDKTYVVALKAMALAAADPAAHRDEIARCVKDLCAWQMIDGTWTYGPRRRNPAEKPLRLREEVGGGLFGEWRALGDSSNTQFALLALHEAARAGVAVEQAVLDRSDKFFRRSITRNGGWGYHEKLDGESASGTMTATALASLHITGSRLNRSAERGFADGAAPGCGEYLQDRHIAAGLDWMARKFRADLVPAEGRSYNVLQNLYYWLYSAERVGVLTGRRTLGGHDWFREGAAILVRLQRADGSWPSTTGGLNVFEQPAAVIPPLRIADTCFALLFLAKGRLPVLVNKLHVPGTRDLDQDDAANLCAFANNEKVFGQPVGWQAISADAPVEEWLAAPLVYLTGHEWPRLTDAQAARIKQFVDQGGTLLVEACCSRPAFDAGFREFVRRQWPDFELARLDASHPVYRARYDLSESPPPLWGVDTACRTGIVYSARDLSCLWQQAAFDDPALREPTLRAFRLGCNVAAYAAGQGALRDKLEEVRLTAASRTREHVPTVRGAVQFAQVAHSGDWKPCAYALPNLAAMLSRQAAVDVVGKPTALRPDDRRLFDHPVAFLTGHYRFELTDREKREFKNYLLRGGFVFAEACCGRAGFDESFRALIGELFPGAEFRAVAADHPLVTGRDGRSAFGYDCTKVRFRAVGGQPEHIAAPRLWLLTLEGRPAVVYSPDSLACGLDGMKCNGCRGLEPADARRLSANVVLWVLGS
jgi:hypothetical protein